MKFKVKYYFKYKMDYGKFTKRYGSYILENNDNSLISIEDAKKIFLNKIKSEDLVLNPILNITKGKILSKEVIIDEIIFLK